MNKLKKEIALKDIEIHDLEETNGKREEKYKILLGQVHQIKERHI